MSYKNLVKDSWDTGHFEELKDDAVQANKEAVVNIFSWRKVINSTREKLIDLADEERKKDGK